VPTLDATGRETRIEDVVLRTPGLEGEAELRSSAPAGTRGPVGITRPALEQALAANDMSAFRTIEIGKTHEVDLSPTRGRGHGDEPGSAIEIEVPDPGPKYGQVLLYQNEAGVVTWHIAQPATMGPAGRGSQARRVYRVPGGVPPAEREETATRGLIGLVGSKVLTAFVFPLVDPVLRRVGDFFAQRWEGKHRPYAVRTFDVADYSMPPARPWTAADWQRVAGGPALLFVHGTGSRTHSGFGALPREFVRELHAAYEGRVFAFDHPTIAATPTENVERFVSQMPDGLRLQLDIVSHSRGGLVSRVLTEQQPSLDLGSRAIAIRRMVMVGVPNAGTALADGDHLGSFIDGYTTILNLLPNPGAADVLEVLITVVKQLAVRAFNGLDGIQSMLADGRFLQALNVPLTSTISAHYYAMGSNFTPDQPGFAQFKDHMIDAIFDKAENDGIVPTAGVAAANGSSLFPVTDSHVFRGAVDHSGYFGNEAARGIIRDWLRAP
jgi:hypothetical protein